MTTLVTASALLSALDSELPEQGHDFGSVIKDTLETVVPNLVHWNHPSFYGYFPTSASFAGMLAELGWVRQWTDGPS